MKKFYRDLLTLTFVGVLSYALGDVPAAGSSLRPIQDPAPPTAPGDDPAPAPILPPVPASEADPAPPGTRPVPVEGTEPPPGLPRASARTRPDTRALAKGMRMLEGVVTELKPGEGEIDANTPGTVQFIRFVVDPSQTWDDFATGIAAEPEPAAVAPPEPPPAPNPPAVTAPEIEDAEPKAAVTDPRATTNDDEDALPQLSTGEPSPVEVVITSRTQIYVHARTVEGQDLHDVPTVSSPTVTPDQARLSALRRADPEFREMRTNFSNISVGSFVSVRFREVNGINEAINVNLIEFPLDPDDVPAGTAAPVPPAQTAPVPYNPTGVSIPR